MLIGDTSQEESGGEWVECLDAPELPPSLAMPPPGTTGEWWTCFYPYEGSVAVYRAYVFVTGDGGPTPFCLTLYLIPEPTEEDEQGAQVGPAEAPLRLPTIPELWDVATEFTLEGALMAPVGPGGSPAIACSGSRAPRFVGGAAYQMVQLGALDGSAAAIRWKLAAAGAIHPAGPTIFPGA